MPFSQRQESELRAGGLGSGMRGGRGEAGGWGVGSVGGESGEGESEARPVGAVFYSG